MAEADVRVRPYWELTFDGDGDVDGGERERLVGEVGDRGVRDLIVFAHGWNNERSDATRLYSRFFAPVPALAPRARLGYVGVIWPSVMIPDEPIPDFPRDALLRVFPDRAGVVEGIAELLERRPEGARPLREFGRLVRLLVEVPPHGPQALCAEDVPVPGGAGSDPLMLTGDTEEVCRDFARALTGLEGVQGLSFTPKGVWDGARELLRQATYFAMKRRAGTVGERGLGPVLGALAQAAPEVRVHLVGHSFGGRLVSFALRGLPEGVRAVKSLTLLQGAFSHYAFADRLPGDPDTGGALGGRQHRVDGPLVCCWSRFDSALGTLYPLASRMAGDDRSMTGGAADGAREYDTEGFDVGRLLGARWGAMGHDGVRSVDGTRALTLADALAGGLPSSGCVNVDASAVVRRGGPPSGAHSDILHPELARVVLAAGRVIRPAAGTGTADGA
ncbi:serine-threonine protein kinase [Streptomyces sp. NPDC048664]|uniref:serine-threonine protein kinase n=1 Tax=Streptomyces sp. NPDC048664 TaxID=3154505 RepID=UPI00342832E7